ncbi:formate dehydrogenase H, selenopolypeptide subunit [Klebsiella pneumoniae]|uniref:Formate dehydrogenase H, selenopolypeptide subunit n=1 Tax=Klebsiella pneumoniae TaxID=573 RepID=A0A447S839_KLEPN|nr:formate dehydrogenase H, selenopolypeptide subunit [Klebsiella pneumoniae]
MTYQWWVGACNELTQDNLDPISKTPENQILCGESGSDCRPAMGGALCLDGLQRHESATGKPLPTSDLRERSALPLPLPVGYAAGSCFSTSPTHMATPGPISASLKS